MRDDEDSSNNAHPPHRKKVWCVLYLEVPVAGLDRTNRFGRRGRYGGGQGNVDQLPQVIRYDDDVIQDLAHQLEATREARVCWACLIRRLHLVC